MVQEENYSIPRIFLHHFALVFIQSYMYPLKWTEKSARSLIERRIDESVL